MLIIAVIDEVGKSPDAKGDSDVGEAALEGLTLSNNDEDCSDAHSDEENVTEPRLDFVEYYSLSEAGEGAMAWEGTLQSMFPGASAFWNRLLSDGRSHRLSTRVMLTFLLNIHILNILLFTYIIL